MVRASVLGKYGSNCFYCGKFLGSNLTLDHRIPESQGGKYDLENLVPACLECNREKGHKSLEQYRAICYEKTIAGATYAVLARLQGERGADGLLTQVEMAALGVMARRIQILHPYYYFAYELAHLDVVGMLAAAEVRA